MDMDGAHMLLIKVNFSCTSLTMLRTLMTAGYMDFCASGPQVYAQSGAKLGLLRLVMLQKNCLHTFIDVIES